MVVLEGYMISEVDDSGIVKYYGYLGSNGNWYILCEDSTAKTYRYAQGGSGYTTAWAARESLTYGYFDEVF